MKQFRTRPYLKYFQFLLLLAIILFNFSPASTGVAHAINCYTLTLTTTPASPALPLPQLATFTTTPTPNCGDQYTEGTIVTVTANPAAGYLFGAWQGDMTSTSNSSNIVMSANKSATVILIADQWQNAIDIGSVPYATTVNTTLANSEEDNEPQAIECAGDFIRGGKATIWYQYTPSVNELVSLDTLGSFQSAVNPVTLKVDRYDTYISVWTGTIDVDPSDGNPHLVACNDDNDAGFISQLGFEAVAGTTYYIQVAQYRGPAGTSSDPYYRGGTLSFHAGFGAQTEVYVGGGLPKGTYTVLAGTSTRDSYPSVNNGPVKVLSANSVPIIAAERVIYKINGVPTSFTEMMALPDSQLSTTYWLPFYNNVDLDTQLRFGNVSGATATVRMYIGGIERTGCTSTPSKAYPYVLAASESVRVSCVGVSNGPVKIVSDQNIVAAERVIYYINGVPTSFSEMMALPNNQLDTTYWLPFYNNVDLDTQLRFGNVSGATATVRMYIGGIEQTGCTSTPSKAYPYVLASGESVRVSCVGVSNGPVKIVSDQNIVAAERVIYKVNNINTSFTETMALPNSRLSTTYLLPFYNNVDLDTQLRFGNVSGATATVRVYIGGIERTSCTSTPSKAYPYVLASGESVRVSCVGVSNGPVRVVSDQNIVAAERVIYYINGVPTSFSEMMGLPNSLLNATYWLPWYNNVDLDTQLRFGTP